MVMTGFEILNKYKNKPTSHTIETLAQLNGCKKREIVNIIYEERSKEYERYKDVPSARVVNKFDRKKVVDLVKDGKTFDEICVVMGYDKNDKLIKSKYDDVIKSLRVVEGYVFNPVEVLDFKHFNNKEAVKVEKGRTTMVKSDKEQMAKLIIKGVSYDDICKVLGLYKDNADVRMEYEKQKKQNEAVGIYINGGDRRRTYTDRCILQMRYFALQDKYFSEVYDSLGFDVKDKKAYNRYSRMRMEVKKEIDDGIDVEKEIEKCRLQLEGTDSKGNLSETDTKSEVVEPIVSKELVLKHHDLVKDKVVKYATQLDKLKEQASVECDINRKKFEESRYKMYKIKMKSDIYASILNILASDDKYALSEEVQDFVERLLEVV